VKLLAVSKTKSAADIRAAFAAGQCAFGENYLQEASEKMLALLGTGIEWHYIGRIQSNKTRSIAAGFDWVHSLTDLRHARRLNEQRPPGMPPLKVCVELAVSDEPNKEGVGLSAARSLVRELVYLPRLELCGVMALPAPAADFAEQRAAFARVRAIRDALAVPTHPLATLSMGMSADLEAAIAEGATVVRVGAAIFGPRVGARLELAGQRG
jgi:pyridoxal phosphate enzyme (YggS family)